MGGLSIFQNLFNFFPFSIKVFIINVFISLFKFISRYFIFRILWGMSMGLLFWFLSHQVWYQYIKKATGYPIWALYPATLLKEFIRLKHFIVECVGSYKNRTIWSKNKDCFTSFFPIYITFIPFSCLVALAKSILFLLNGSGKNGYYWSLCNVNFVLFHM